VGQKVHPVGFRVGVIRDWHSKWYSDRRQTYRDLVQEDVKIRRRVESMRDAGISSVDIDRNANQVSVTIKTARPGIVIGRQGKNVEDLRKELETLTGKKVRVNIVEINVPELDAKLVARNIADQLERRVAHRRAMKQTAQRTMQRGAQGIKINVGGRLGGADMSRKDKEMQGRVPLHTLRADIDYGTAEARTTFGQIGVKVWIYKGEVLPERAAGATQGEEPPREGPAPAIAPESVRGPEVGGPEPSAEALAEATGQPAPKTRRTRKSAVVADGAAPDADADGGPEEPAATEPTTAEVAVQEEPTAETADAPQAGSTEEGAVEEAPTAKTPEVPPAASTGEATDSAEVAAEPDGEVDSAPAESGEQTPGNSARTAEATSEPAADAAEEENKD
jgi:small subunit ribosomal protein S3